MTADRDGSGTPIPAAEYATLSFAQRALVCLFIGVGLSYLAWRPSTFNPDALAFSIILYAAEVFGFACAMLYLVMCWRLSHRTPPPVPRGMTAAVFVPTINESVDLVRRTLLAARRMRHAGEVWLLDDGARPEMHALADELGCRYLARTGNSHAKAGNLNNALRHTSAKLIAIFDADHAPAENFLEETLGFFTDDRVAFVQTPQDFYNLDSFQHRTNYRESLVWSEQTLFFRVIQPGKDRLNSAFFCGSCAVIRRAALDDIGGFATGTVTEDIHTSIRLHKRGWRSVYHSRSLAFGLAPASLIPFLKQRLRWGQGAMQVWRKEGILFTKGLSPGQRLSYLATVLAYFEGWQRLIFFLAPVAVLTLGVMPILQFDREFLLRFVPYYVLTFWVFEEVARGHGRALLTEQYNMLRFAVFVTATFGFFLRRLRFVVTPKRMGDVDATRSALWPQYLVAALNAAAVPAGLYLHWRYAWLPTGALISNLAWASVTCGLAALTIRFALRFASYRRREYRFPLPVPLRLNRQSGGAVVLATDLSPQGFKLVGTTTATGDDDVSVRGELLLPNGPVAVQASVRSRSTIIDDAGRTVPCLGCEFRWDSIDGRDRLELFLYGSDLQWRLNGLDDRIPTPIEHVGNLLLRRPRTRVRLSNVRWSPLVFVSNDPSAAAAVGYISATGSNGGERTVVAMSSLPGSDALEAQEITPAGVRGVIGSISDEEMLETRALPVFLYRLSA